jgi:hypothetical protein
MSLLTAVQRTCRRVGVPAPSSVVNNADVTVQQMLALAIEEGRELSDRFNWQVLTKEGTFTTLAQEDQGLVTAIASDFARIVNDTMYDRTDRRPVYGPVTPQDWQQIKGSVSTSVQHTFRVRGGKILFDPAPPAGHAIHFEYVSKNWVTDDQDTFTADSDTSLIDEELITLGLVWRFREAKGFDYSEAFRKYEIRLANAIARDGGKAVLDLSNGRFGRVRPSLVPDGNWGL